MKSILLILLCIGSARAVDFCVTTSAEFVIAMSAADTNLQDDHIKLAEGIYLAPAAGFFYNQFQSNDIEFSGGWTEFMGNPCGQQFTGSPFATTLSGNSQSRVMEIRPPRNGHVKISSLNFVDGSLTKVGENGGGLWINSHSDSNGTIVIERNSFVNNSASSGAALYVQGADRTEVRNNLFYFNFHSVPGFMTHAVHLETDRTFGIYVINNTIMYNEGGLQVSVDGGFGAQAMIVNNIIWENDESFTSDLFLPGNGIKYLYNNNVSTLSGADFQSGNISLPTLFESGLFNFTPSIISPLINAGLNPTITGPNTPFLQGWHPGNKDMLGNPRFVDSIDIGAYESQIQIFIFIDGFED